MLHFYVCHFKIIFYTLLLHETKWRLSSENVMSNQIDLFVQRVHTFAIILQSDSTQTGHFRNISQAQNDGNELTWKHN